MSKAGRFCITTVLSVLCLAAIPTAQQTAPEMPMQAKYEDGAEFRWLNKKVLDSRVLDSMEDLSNWSFTGAGEMTLDRRTRQRWPAFAANPLYYQRRPG